MDAVDEIKQRLSIEEVVSSYIKLKKAGKNYKGLCPFHSEKTPSFTVSEDKQIYHCFGCGEGGDMFDFVMKMDGLDFRGSLEVLAQKAGVDLDQYQSGPSDGGKQKKRLSKILDFSVKYYQKNLATSKQAVEYISKKRGLNRETALVFRLGYSPRGGGLVSSLRKAGFKDEDIRLAGVTTTKSGNIYDLFRGRMMIPLINSQGQVVGFTARVLDDRLPKYINSPQTRLYDKSRLVFGLHNAKEAIRSEDSAVIVEGNLDVLTSHQHGVKNVVAISGTALTEQQLKKLSRFTKNISLAFDQDQAGIKATERSIPLAQKVGVNLRVVDLPESKDPDELIRSDKSKWLDAVENAKYSVDWLLDALENQYDLKTTVGVKSYTDKVAEIIRGITDDVERDRYIQILAKRVSVSSDAIKQKVSSKTPPKKVVKEAAYRADMKMKNESEMLEEALLGINLAFPEARISVEDCKEGFFTTPERQDIYHGLEDLGNASASDNLPDSLKKHESYVKILLLQGEEQYSDWDSTDVTIEALGLVHRLQATKSKNYKKQLSEKIQAAEDSGDEELSQKLLKEYQALIKQES